MGRAWFRSLTTWMDRIRPGVMGPTGAGNPPDPSMVNADPDLWARLIDANVAPEILRLFEGPYREVAPGRDSEGDPYALEYLRGARNRLVRLPDEVYSLIVGEIERGVRDGLSIPDISDAVNRLLTSTGSDRWTNRAVTVARTETIGATNAGAFAGALRRALDENDTTAEKIWISTADERTRPSHRMADQQRVPLLTPFDVGGAALMFPGDPSGPADEVINCRCSLLDVVAGETIDWTNRQFEGEDDL